VIGVLAGGGIAWAVTSSGSGSHSAKSFALRGSLRLVGGATASGPTSEDCTGYGGYDDIVPGAAVTVYDANGSVVATGLLGTGRPKSPTDNSVCSFPVTVPGVPSGSRFYSVEITHRGKVTVSAADAQAGKFAATLG